MSGHSFPFRLFASPIFLFLLVLPSSSLKAQRPPADVILKSGFV